MDFRKSLLTRRGVIGSAIGGLVGAIGFAYPGLARVLEAPSRMAPRAADSTNWRVDNFTSGEVIAKNAESLTLASAEGSRVVRVPPGKTIWKEFDVSIDDVEIGEWVMASGSPQPDGSLLGRPGWIWASISQWSGTVAALEPDGLLLHRRDGRTKKMYFSTKLEVIRAHDQTVIAVGPRALSVGKTIGAVGLVLPDKTLRATRLWIDP